MADLPTPSYVRGQRFKAGPGMAECEEPGCWIDPSYTRRQARAHVQGTGHAVRFVVEEVTRYERVEHTRRSA